MPGDVIIYQKNGGTDTPVIHRAILKALRNETAVGTSLELTSGPLRRFP